MSRNKFKFKMTTFDWIALALIILMGILWYNAVLERTAVGFFQVGKSIFWEEIFRGIFIATTTGFIFKKFYNLRKV